MVFSTSTERRSVRAIPRSVLIIETKSASFGATFDSTGYFSASHITSNIEQFCTAAIVSSVETVVSPYLSLRLVDDSAQPQPVARIVDNAEIRKNIRPPCAQRSACRRECGTVYPSARIRPPVLPTAHLRAIEHGKVAVLALFSRSASSVMRLTMYRASSF